MSSPGPLTGSSPLTFTVQGVASVGSGSTPSGATHIPPGIISLPDGTYLKGVIARFDARRQPVLQTVKGDITLASTLPLKLGQEVVLRLETKADGLHARLITIDGKTLSRIEAGQVAPPVDEVTLGQFTLDDELPARPAPRQGVPMQNTQEQTVSVKTSAIAQVFRQESGGSGVQASATLIQRAPDLPQHLARLPASIPVPATQLQPGASVQMTITLPPTDAARPPAQPSPALNANFASASRAYGGMAATGTSTPPFPPAPPYAPLPSQTLTTATAHMPPPAQWTVTVLQQEPDGVVLRSPLGLLHLPVQNLPGAASWQPGLQLTAQPMAIMEAPLPDAGQPISAASSLDDYASLEALAQYAAQAASNRPMHELVGILPKPDSGFVALVMHFFGALKQQSAEYWLGRSYTHLVEEAGKSDLIKRLGGDLARHFAASSEINSAGWQQIVVPYWGDDVIRYARFHFHRDREQERATAEDGEAQRFIIELDFDHIGQTQLDGFIRRIGRGEPLRFDLVLRTALPLAQRHIEGVSAIYRQAAEEASFHGQLSFRLIDPNEPAPWRERGSASHGWTA